MKPSDVGLAVMVAVIWGLAFEAAAGSARDRVRGADVAAASGLALPGIGRMMMPQRAMRDEGFPWREKALDNAGNSRATGGPPNPNA